ncbi:MAG: mammalian cell entry protein [Nocardia sp.]|uniref:MlaD family protein n=1 Tax=Nocardia sp. TaxID=1821 RepID=UPI002636F32D|nr:MlaD family protein [Nocardia sp.]MCU1647690.1 mammalian cell entry protein [Nocardia sp.]
MTVLRKLLQRKVLLTNLGLVVALLVGGTYLFVGMAGINPLRDTYTVRIEMTRSGGLMRNSDVTLRGFRVGSISSITLTSNGIEALARINSSARIPSGGIVAVQSLSAVGEQYLDFRPTTNDGPYLKDGALIVSKDVTTPVPMADVLENSNALIAQLDPASDPTRFQTIITELDKALGGGPDQLRSLISGISAITVGMENVLPQTVALLTNLRTIAGTTAHIQPDLATLTANSSTLFQQLTAADSEVRKLLDLGPGQLATLGSVLNETSDPVTSLATNFLAIARSARLRTPAMRELFPALRDGAGALGLPAHEGEFHTLVDIWPRQTCEYEAVPVSPTQLNGNTVRRWNFCVTNNPALQIRGSANAPRPDLPDNGAQRPPGVDPNEQSVPVGPAPR